MVKILDTTLREGEQTPGVYFDVHIKVAIAELLDEVGVDIHHAVREIARRGFRAKVGAHSRSLKRDVDLALECGVGFLGVFYCVSDMRLNHHAKSLKEAIDQITTVISYAKEKKPDLTVRYTPEDAVRSPFENVITAAAEAARAGADVISIADTTGYMIPGSKNNMYDYIKKLRDELDKNGVSPKIAVHCHNDRGLALANALDGYRAGAETIDASVLGLGERAGIVDLASLLVVLTQDFGEEKELNLKKIPELYRMVSRYSGVEIPVNLPITGRNAFTHCAGVHTQAAIRNPLHYQSLDPAVVGREPRIALDHMSGLSSVVYSLEQIGEADVD